MSKLSNCIQMLILLQSKGCKVKVKDLAEQLEVNERMIRHYRDELEKARIFINIESGRYGGYSLARNSFLKVPSLTEEEFSAIQSAQELLSSDDRYIFRKSFENALHKITAASDVHDNSEHTTYIVKEQRINYDSEAQKEKYLKINAAIIEKKKINILYYSNASGKTERIIHPYALFTYKGFWYCMAYCQYRKKFLDFKLNRILNYAVTDENFIPEKDFNFDDHIGKTGIYKGEKIKVKLRIHPPMAIIVSERIWGEEQFIEFHDDRSISFEAYMEDTPELKSWLLSMGSSVEIVSPEKIKNEIRKEITKIYNKF